MDTKRTVVIVATLDTKAAAASYLRDEITAWGLDTVLIDPGILGSPGIRADIDRWQVAEAAGTTLQALIASGERQACIARQTEGLCIIVKRLHESGRLDGIISLGGSQGTFLGTAAMQVLPLGVPKLMLSTAAAGSNQFGPYIGTKDICMMHSVTGILDVNPISRPVLSNAANAIAGMVLRASENTTERTATIGITQTGMTAPCVRRLRNLLVTQGFQVVPFHANGAGGQAMEELVREGKFAGVIDLSLHEIIDHLLGGFEGAPDRLKSLSIYRLPAVVSLGGIDYVTFDSLERAPERFKGRPSMALSERMAAFQPAVEEMQDAAHYLAEQLNRALGPTIVVVPSVGFSDANQPGRELWNPAGSRAAIAVLQSELREEVPLVIVEAHINQPVFADVVAACFARLLAGEHPGSIAARYQF